MKYKINNEEKELIVKFKNMKIPVIFKTDNTDRILFVEDVNSFVCDLLLKGKKIPDSLYSETMNDYKKFINDTDVNEFDDYALKHFSICVKIVEIMKKYYEK